MQNAIIKGITLGIIAGVAADVANKFIKGGSNA